MTSSVREDVISRLEVSGATIELVDYEWRSGDTICEQEEQHLLRWRVFPTRLRVSPNVESHAQFGRLMFFPAEAVVRTDQADVDQRSRCITCRFDRTWFSEVASVPKDWCGPDLVESLDISNPNIDYIVQRLGVEASQQGHASHSLTQALAEVLAVEIARHFLSQRTLRLQTRDSVLPPWALQRIGEYVSAHTDRNISVAELAKLCAVSESHLSRVFKSTTGQTVHAFVTEMRIERAKAMLASDLPLKAVAHDLGFSDPSAFSTTFRRICGETPSVFRARLNA